MAVHSSSALVCNVFEHWRFRDKEILSKALGYPNIGIKSLVYEQKLSMGLKGSRPNLDVFCILNDGRALAIESKFTEWLSKKSKKKLFSDSYFKDDARLWQDVGLPNCQRLAYRLREESDLFQYLNSAQLLKHALGLANVHGINSHLLYLFYDFAETEISKLHWEEIEKFQNLISNELRFKATTYQNLVGTLRKNSTHQDYLSYLNHRYLL